MNSILCGPLTQKVLAAFIDENIEAKPVVKKTVKPEEMEVEREISRPMDEHNTHRMLERAVGYNEKDLEALEQHANTGHVDGTITDNCTPARLERLEDRIRFELEQLGLLKVRLER